MCSHNIFLKLRGQIFSGGPGFDKLKFVKMFQAISGLHTNFFRNDGHLCRQFKQIFNKNDLLRII